MVVPLGLLCLSECVQRVTIVSVCFSVSSVLECPRKGHHSKGRARTRDSLGKEGSGNRHLRLHSAAQ